MRYQIKGRRKLGNVEMLEDLASRGHRMDVNGRKGKREKSFNGLSARPASCSSFSFSLSLSLPPFPLPLYPPPPRSDVWTHIVISMDVRTRPIVNLIILVTSDKRCRQNVIPTRSLTCLTVLVWNSKWWPTLLAIRAPPSLPLFLFGFSPRSQFSPMPPPPPLLPFQPWRDLTSERDWRTLRSPPLSYPFLSLSAR